MKKSPFAVKKITVADVCRKARENFDNLQCFHSKGGCNVQCSYTMKGKPAVHCVIGMTILPNKSDKALGIEDANFRALVESFPDHLEVTESSFQVLSKLQSIHDDLVKSTETVEEKKKIMRKALRLAERGDKKGLDTIDSSVW